MEIEDEEEEDDEEEEEEVKKPEPKKKDSVNIAATTTAATTEGGETFEVFVKGLSYDADEAEITNFFADCGGFDSINLLKGP